MEKYGPSVDLERYRRDALHRHAMCRALAEDDARYAPIADSAQASVAAIDARSVELRRVLDLLTLARALEDARHLTTKQAYDQARRDLAAEAASLVRTLLPTAPAALGKVGIKRAIALVEPALKNLQGADAPETVRTEHAPALERQLSRLRAADLAEDDCEANLAAMRAGIVVFKAARQAEREAQYGLLVTVAGSRSAADMFFLRAYARGDDDDDETNQGGGGGSES